MITWIFKGFTLVGALSLLSGCEEGLQGLNVAAAPAAKPLTQARMANGDVTLNPPPGYCIDKTSLRPMFALMARCDVLGAAQPEGDAPLGVITVSLLRANGDGTIPSPDDTAKAAKLSRVADAVTTDGAVVFQADGPVPITGMSPRHWRGTALKGKHIFAVAFYGPDGGRAIGSAGRTVVNSLITRSTSGT